VYVYSCAKLLIQTSMQSIAINSPVAVCFSMNGSVTECFYSLIALPFLQTYPQLQFRCFTVKFPLFAVSLSSSHSDLKICKTCLSQWHIQILTARSSLLNLVAVHILSLPSLAVCCSLLLPCTTTAIILTQGNGHANRQETLSRMLG
jgi:hypothetical protein